MPSALPSPAARPLKCHALKRCTSWRETCLASVIALRLVNQRARAANHCVRTLYHTPRCLSVQSIRWQKPCAVFADIFWHRAKVCITKAEISMCTWRSPTRAASQGVFVVIPEISHSDISSIKKPHADMYLSWGFGVYALVNRR